MVTVKVRQIRRPTSCVIGQMTSCQICGHEAIVFGWPFLLCSATPNQFEIASVEFDLSRFGVDNEYFVRDHGFVARDKQMRTVTTI